jgi:hypothetical protein
VHQWGTNVSVPPAGNLEEQVVGSRGAEQGQVGALTRADRHWCGEIKEDAYRVAGSE